MPDEIHNYASGDTVELQMRSAMSKLVQSQALNSNSQYSKIAAITAMSECGRCVCNARNKGSHETFLVATIVEAFGNPGQSSASQTKPSNSVFRSFI